jgi:hypothetical protein
MPQIPRWQSVCASLALALVLASCSKPAAVEQISETRTLTTPREVPKQDLSSAERLGTLSQPVAPQGAMQPQFSWVTPEGWAEVPATQFRPVNLRPAGDPKAECYVTQLGGGITENVNRWRGQMGQPPVDDAAIAALPKKPLMGAEAYYVEVEGNYTGMSGDQNNPDFKMIGLILPLGGTSVFVKFTGPKALVEQELPKFDAFCASIRPPGAPQSQVAAATPPPAPASAEVQAPAATTPPAAAAPMPAPQSSAGAELKWIVPAGWVQKGGKTSFREVTFAPAEGSNTECYISKLGNLGGGMKPNLDRWAGQMGAEPLSEEAIAALPKIRVLGKESPLVELKGTYRDMSGGSHPDSIMLGTISEVGTDAYFIKMVGPAAEVEAQKAGFTAFCESLAL